MKAQQLIEFLQGRPEADVIMVVDEPGVSVTPISSLRYVSPKELSEADRKLHPHGIVFIERNNIF